MSYLVKDFINCLSGAILGGYEVPKEIVKTSPKITNGYMQLKVVSFNILAEQFIDYKDLSADYPGVPAKVLKEAQRLPKIFAFLIKSSPDIALLQEVNPKVLLLIKAKFAKYYKIFPLALHHTEEAKMKGNAYGNLIMVKHGICTNAKQTVYRVPKLGSAFAVVNCIINGRAATLINIHLDADEETEAKRIIEVRALMRFIKPLLATNAILISGDFNTSDRKTHAMFKELNPIVEDPMGTYLDVPAMIDWIYVRNLYVVKGHVVRPARGNAATPLKKYGSDHYPIIGIVKI